MKRHWVVGLGGVLAVLLVGVSVAPLEGQRHRRGDYFDSYSQPRVFLDLGLLVADPVGEFADFVDDGVGLGGGVAFAVDPAGILRLRLDGGFLVYGHESHEVCVSDRVGCRILADLTTTNQIAHADFGAEVGVNVGPVRPYVGLSRGLSYFETSSSLDGVDDYDHESFLNTTNFDDLVWGWKSRAGLQFRVSRGRTPVYLDVGAVYHENGVAEYLTEGDIQDNADGSITVFPVLSEANLVTMKVGVSIGIGGRDHYDDDYRDYERDRRRRRRH